MAEPQNRETFREIAIIREFRLQLSRRFMTADGVSA